jgi:hypothetical protein
MSAIVETRCRNHPEREAVARCLTCGRYYCRECITEHHNRMICGRCLRTAPETRRRRRLFSTLLAASRITGGVLVLWLTFYTLGSILSHCLSQWDLRELIAGLLPVTP